MGGGGVVVYEKGFHLHYGGQVNKVAEVYKEEPLLLAEEEGHAEGEEGGEDGCVGEGEEGGVPQQEELEEQQHQHAQHEGRPVLQVQPARAKAGEACQCQCQCQCQLLCQ